MIIGLIAVVVVVVVVVIVVRFLRAGRRVVQNVAEEERAVPARVVGKRQETRGGGDSPVTTLSYATFELPDGDRMELKVPRQQYGQLAERDQGQLTHRGTWFRGFERARTTPLEGPWEAPGGPTPLPPSSTP